MALEIVGAPHGERPGGLAPLEGSAEVMQQVAALAPLNETQKMWSEDVRVGDAVVKLGLRPGGEALIRITRLPRRE